MDYNWDLAISSLHNVVNTLNKGGTFTVRQIAEDLWEEAPSWKISDKVHAARKPELRNLSYAKKQLRQEVRRTLDDLRGEESWYEILSIKPYGSPELFYVVECQEEYVELDEVELEDQPEPITALQILNALRTGEFHVE